ncbi:hypothetical protein [Serratia marcescens]|uniref:hypothetical protein n=1 Tax=Serratia TaxID=613 RepID=UPI00066734C4|nr:hypothetical protein [Serratia marcescens]
MAFRAEEAAHAGFERAYKLLVPQGAGSSERLKIKNKLQEIIKKCGPVVDGYPAWHPFMSEADPEAWAPMTPNNLPSFNGLDHTVYFQNGILTCPYGHVDELITKINAFEHKDAEISITRLKGITLYNAQAVPLLIQCDWNYEWKEHDGTFNLRTALGLMLEREIPNWRWAPFCETWENMSSQIIGEPHGARSSLFVNQVTGQKLKNVWNQIIKSGLLGVPKD